MSTLGPVLVDLLPKLLVASVAAFALALLSAVAGFGGGVLLLPVFTALFGLRAAIPILTLTQLSSNGSRIWFNRSELRWSPIGWFALGAIPCAVVGGLLLAHAPLSPLKRLLGAFLIAVVIWRRLRPEPRKPPEPAFGAVGPLTAPFFLALGLTRGAYIGTAAASALTMHFTKIATYGAGELLTAQVLLFGIALTPASLLGTWAGKKIVGCISDHLFVLLVEIGLIVAGVIFLLGL